MTAQKRPLPPPASDDDSHGHVAVRRAATSRGGGGASHGSSSDGEPAARRSRAATRETHYLDPDAEGRRRGDGSGKESESSMSAGDEDEFILVKLAEIRKEVQCPICLGIIRKTRTVMECLHRFCRDCIDKSMRLGNNECPACRTHCASRRSLRDDPNYDALIATLYPDIDKYEEQEFAFSEEEKTRNKKIQATIEETIRKQSEAIGKKCSTAKATATAFARKYRRNMRTRGRGRTVARDIVLTVSDNEDREEVNANDASKESSSADNHSPDLKQKRGRKRPPPLPSPDRIIASSDHGSEENGEPVSVKENFTSSPLRGEMLAWGKNGTRSQIRHGNVGGLNCRLGKGGRVAKLVEHLRTTDEMDKEFNLYLVLLPLDGKATPELEKPYLSCRPTVSIRHLVQLIALQLSRQVEELEIYMRMDLHNRGVATDSSSAETNPRLFDGLERLRGDKLLSDLGLSFASGRNDVELLYALKTRD
ncbi:hypothetical protein QYE76_055987 [Lolium multiflorum]|uniref:RING-type domain-containing protein n=1 Tax=Lolium multiflorum TaxID=4521 RepID=A0AAD8T0R9_LOLMU|nr:hypothetical protein QYE76_055987 [Lolium multiflorum]